MGKAKGKTTKNMACKPTTEEIAIKEEEMAKAKVMLEQVLERLSVGTYTGLDGVESGVTTKLKLALTKLEGALTRKDAEEMFGKSVQEAVATATQAELDYPRLPAVDQEPVAEEEVDAVEAAAAPAPSATEVAEEEAVEQAEAQVIGLFEPEPIQLDGAPVPPPSSLTREGDVEQGQQEEGGETRSTLVAADEEVGDSEPEQQAEGISAEGEGEASQEPQVLNEELHAARLAAIEPTPAPATGGATWAGTLAGTGAAVAAVALLPQAVGFAAAVGAGLAARAAGNAISNWWWKGATAEEAQAVQEAAPAPVGDVVPTVEEAALTAEQDLAGRGAPSGTFVGYDSDLN